MADTIIISGLPNAESTARKIYVQGCHLDEYTSCAKAAALVFQEHPPVQEIKQWMPLLQQSCDTAIPLACHLLGELHERGQGVSSNPNIATDYFQKGCALNHTKSCAQLGLKYSTGIGINKDIHEAQTLLSSACEKGRSERMLGII